jgi:N-methylhydantoinase A
MPALVRAGIDVGGTFTDAVLLDSSSRLTIAKVRTTPDDLAGGFLGAIEALAERAGVPTEAIAYLAHGSTVAANALVEGRAARVGLLTTAGFRDVLEIGTQQRRSLYDLRLPKPPPLVPRPLRIEAHERVGPDGEVLRPLEPAGVEAAARVFRREAVEAVAVCFLFSYANPAHEVEAGEILERLLPGIPVSLSSEVAPELREYLRTSTTVVNASLLPLVGRYLASLAGRLGDSGVSVRLHLMQSNGGVASGAEAARLPVSLIASGPAAGVIGAARLGAVTGQSDLLTFDMGGTTADVSLVVGGEPQMRFRGEAAGHSVNLPQIDVLSVGAGGGSIARVDRFGSLSVGPESAGADPGPAAYGSGGEHATVTDAHTVLGTLDPARFLGGRMALDRAAARRAVERQVGGPLGLSTEEAAAAVLRIANATMVRALHVVSIGRGHDPRRFALVAFGGAGPMHACAIAEELGIARIVVPRYPGVASAFGLLLSDVRHDVRRTWVRLTRSLRAEELSERLGALEREALDVLARAGFENGAGRVDFELDVRYRGQAYELTVPVRPGRPLADVEQAFHEAHEQAYGHASPVADTEIVTLRARASAALEAPDWNGLAASPAASSAASSRLVTTPGRGPERYALHERETLDARDAVAGPAIVEQDDSTIVVAPGWLLGVGAAGSVVLERAAP